MADKVIGVKLEADTGSATTNVKNFKQELKLATAEVVAMNAKFGATSKEAAEAAKKAAGLKDAIGDAKSLVDAFNPDTKFRAFGASINTVVGGFSALQGVMGLVGVESEETQKMLLKVQSALAISQGWAQVQEGVQTFKNLGAVIQSTTIFQKVNSAVTAIAATVMRAFGASAVTSATGFQILKVAIASTGIGLLIVGLGLLIPKIIDWVNSTNDAALSQDALNESVERLNESLDKNLNKIEFSTKKRLILAETAGKSEADIQKIREEGLRKELTQLTVAANTKAALANRAIAENELEVSELNKIRDDALSAESARQKKFEELQLSGLQFQSTTAKKQREQSKANAEKASAQAKALRQQALKEAEEENARRLANFTASGGPGGGLNIEVPKSIEQLQIENTLAAARLSAEEKAKIREQESTQEATLLNEKRDSAINQILLDEQVYQNRRTLLTATGDLFSALGNLIGKQTAAGKILGVAQATINTFIGATEVLRAKSVLPEPLGTIAKIANVAAVIATGLAAVKSIVKVQVPGGGGGSTPNLSLSAPLTPQAAQQQTTTLDQASLNAIGSATTRAFVLEADIENNRERVVRLNRAARLGG